MLFLALLWGLVVCTGIVAHAWWRYGVDPEIEHLWWILKGRPKDA